MASCGSGIGFKDPVAIAAGDDPTQLPTIDLVCSLEPGHDGRHQAYYGAGLFEWPDLTQVLTEVRLLAVSIDT